MSGGFTRVLLIVLATILVLILLLAFLETGFIEIVGLLMIGFVPFLRDACQRLGADWIAIATGVISLIVFALGTHVLATRLWASPQRHPWRARWTMIGVLGMLTIFAAGIAMIGVVHQVTWLQRGPIIHSSRPHAVHAVIQQLFRLAEAKHIDAVDLRRHADAIRHEDEFRIAIIADDQRAVRAIAATPRDPKSRFRYVVWIRKAEEPALPSGEGMLPAELYEDVVRALERGLDPEQAILGDPAKP
ncbi:MAG: hypothetical protein H0X45_14155 [Planctomycetes bacterium]|nr:hypothetical protein [Planctomycetota bacterium]